MLMHRSCRRTLSVRRWGSRAHAFSSGGRHIHCLGRHQRHRLLPCARWDLRLTAAMLHGRPPPARTSALVSISWQKLMWLSRLLGAMRVRAAGSFRSLVNTRSARTRSSLQSS